MLYLQFSAKTRLLVATKWSLWCNCIITVNPGKFNVYVYHGNIRLVQVHLIPVYQNLFCVLELKNAFLYGGLVVDVLEHLSV